MSDLVLKINGSKTPIGASPDETLLSVLRDRLHLTGTKYGCGEGQCGACTVLLDGKAVHSCQTQVSYATGKQIVTVEGLAQKNQLTPVQQAFVDEGAFQCGYCTSGMVLRATALLQEQPNPTDQQILSGMSGNLCRCGVYPRILSAVRRAAHAASSRQIASVEKERAS